MDVGRIPRARSTLSGRDGRARIPEQQVGLAGRGHRRPPGSRIESERMLDKRQRLGGTTAADHEPRAIDVEPGVVRIELRRRRIGLERGDPPPKQDQRYRKPRPLHRIGRVQLDGPLGALIHLVREAPVVGTGVDITLLLRDHRPRQEGGREPGLEAERAFDQRARLDRLLERAFVDEKPPGAEQPFHGARAGRIRRHHACGFRRDERRSHPPREIAQPRGRFRRKIRRLQHVAFRPEMRLRVGDDEPQVHRIRITAVRDVAVERVARAPVRCFGHVRDGRAPSANYMVRADYTGWPRAARTRGRCPQFAMILPGIARMRASRRR